MKVIPAISVQNAHWTAIAALLDAQTAPGKLQIYTGTRPASGGTLSGNTKMIEFVLKKPCTNAITGGVWTLADIDYAQVLATGTHTFARMVDGSGNFVADIDTGVTSVTLADGTFGALLLSKANYSAGEYILFPPSSLVFQVPT